MLKRVSRISIVATFAIAAFAVVACILWMISCEDRASPQASPHLDIADDDEGFPYVDWDYWLSINPDIIAWVTVPQTHIDHPIVRAPRTDPSYYLDHDIYREYNPMGTPYLDAECADGIDSANALVFGHHWGEDQVFADFSRFADLQYAVGRSPILLQTPASKRKLGVLSVEILNGNSETKAVQFESRTAFESWLSTRYEASELKMAGESIGGTIPESVITFCTCSYRSYNDRTLVYTAEEYA